MELEHRLALLVKRASTIVAVLILIIGLAIYGNV